jgi:hypothetical protein
VEDGPIGVTACALLETRQHSTGASEPDFIGFGLYLAGFVSHPMIFIRTKMIAMIRIVFLIIKKCLCVIA